MSTCRIALPSAIAYPRSTPSFNTQTLSASTHKLAFVFTAQDSTSIEAFGVRLNNITGTSPTFQVELQGVDGSGFPDGVGLIGSSATFNPSSLGWAAGSFNWINIPGINIIRGTPYAVVIRHSSGTINTSNNATFNPSQSSVVPEGHGLPYAIQDTGSGWAKSTSPDPIFGYRSSSMTYGLPIQNWITGSINTNGHRAALKLALDTGWGSTFQARGLMIHWMALPAGGTYKLGIWTAAGTEVAAVTLDSDHANTTSARSFRAFFSSLPTLSFGTTYYFGIERVSPINIAPRFIEVSANRDLEAYPFGSSAILSTWDGSTWTDTNNQMLPLTLYFADWSKPASSAASIVMG